MDITLAVLLGDRFEPATEHGPCVWRGEPHPLPSHRDTEGRLWGIDLGDVWVDSTNTAHVLDCNR